MFVMKYDIEQSKYVASLESTSVAIDINSNIICNQ